jgi:hypothetical protein
MLESLNDSLIHDVFNTENDKNIANMSEAKKLNKDLLKIIQLTSQELIRLKGNDEFYDNYDNATKFLDIIGGESSISIRLIDYFITEYSKVNKCSYKFTENNKENVFNIHFDYKNQLKYYQKIHFDPFSRGDRIPFFMNDTCIITTIGQLNFFRWFISKNIYEYVITKKNLIYECMSKKNVKDLKNVLKTPKQGKTKEKCSNDTNKKSIFLFNNNINLLKKSINITVSFE